MKARRTCTDLKSEFFVFRTFYSYSLVMGAAEEDDITFIDYESQPCFIVNGKHGKGGNIPVQFTTADESKWR